MGPADRRPALIFWEYVVMAKVYRDPLEPTPLEDYIDSFGRECPNPIPVAPPVGFVRQPSMVDHLRTMVRSELLRREVIAQGVETFEEADDFDIPDDPVDPHTPYEAVFDPPAAEPEPARAPPGGAPASPPPIITAGIPAAPEAAPTSLAAPAAPVANPAKPV